MARAGGTDWVLSQITSKAYSDPLVVPLRAGSFAEGGLPLDSFVRPSKLFTANESIIVRQVGQLSDQAHREVVDAVVRLIRERV